jgi:DNA-binding transcriptional LysR family regulator
MAMSSTGTGGHNRPVTETVTNQAASGADARTARLAAALAPRLAMLRAVADEGGVTRAAAALGMPQPTVSRWLAVLSEELGTPVTVRDGRGVRLSRPGALLADAAGQALRALENGCRAVAEELDPSHGRVVLAFLHTMGELRVPQLLRTFRAERPHVRFTLIQGRHEDLLERVRTGAADLALTAPPPTGSDFDYIEVEQQPVVLAVPIDHRLARRRSVRMAELADEPFIGMKAGFGMRKITDELCAAEGFRPRLAFEGENLDTVRGLVAAGLGVSLTPVTSPAPPRGVAEIPLRPPVVRRIGLVWAADRPLPPAVAAFRDFALRAAGDAIGPGAARG